MGFITCLLLAQPFFIDASVLLSLTEEGGFEVSVSHVRYSFPVIILKYRSLYLH